MADEEEPTFMDKGYISTEHTVWCPCGTWDQASSRTKRFMAKIARKSGWKNTRKHGWLCPKCVEKMKVR